MSQLKFNLNGRGLKVTNKMQVMVEDRLSNFDRFKKMILQLEFEIGQNKAHKGVKNDCYVRALATLPHAKVRVKKEGKDVLVLIDSVMDILEDRLQQYLDNLRHWQNKESWPEIKAIQDQELDDGIRLSYEPKVRIKVLEEASPMSISEAIERMELLGRVAYFFKNIETSHFEMIYQDSLGQYVLVRPPQ